MSIINPKRTSLGIKFGTACLRGVLINEYHKIVAQGEHHWENRLENGL